MLGGFKVLSGYIYSYTPFVNVRILNPFLGVSYPEDDWLLAVIDTGFTGFLLVPEKVFMSLGLGEQRVKVIRARTADGREVELRGAYASLILRGLNVVLDGLVETHEGVEEVLLGMRALRGLRVILNSCTGTVSIDVCR